MHQIYKEILDAFDTPPLWFTEGGFPRWCEKHPANCDDIYADQVVFAVIGCQGCMKTFKVAFSSNKMARLMGEQVCLLSQINNRSLHYGDPPNVQCCPAGPTMNSQLLLIEQVWERDLEKLQTWQRLQDFEDEQSSVPGH